MGISLNRLSGLHCNTKYDLIFSEMKKNLSNKFNTLITEDSFLFFFFFADFRKTEKASKEKELERKAGRIRRRKRRAV